MTAPIVTHYKNHRERQMRRFKSPQQAQRFLSVHSPVIISFGSDGTPLFQMNTSTET